MTTTDWKARAEAAEAWGPMETAPKDQRVLLLFNGGIICSGRKRHGNLGEPSQDTFDWRCDCCGRFGGAQGWMLSAALAEARVVPTREEIFRELLCGVHENMRTAEVYALADAILALLKGGTP